MQYVVIFIGGGEGGGWEGERGLSTQRRVENEHMVSTRSANSTGDPYYLDNMVTVYVLVLRFAFSSRLYLLHCQSPLVKQPVPSCRPQPPKPANDTLPPKPNTGPRCTVDPPVDCGADAEIKDPSSAMYQIIPFPSLP